MDSKLKSKLSNRGCAYHFSLAKLYHYSEKIILN